MGANETNYNHNEKCKHFIIFTLYKKCHGTTMLLFEHALFIGCQQ